MSSRYDSFMDEIICMASRPPFVEYKEDHAVLWGFHGVCLSYSEPYFASKVNAHLERRTDWSTCHWMAKRGWNRSEYAYEVCKRHIKIYTKGKATKEVVRSVINRMLVKLYDGFEDPRDNIFRYLKADGLVEETKDSDALRVSHGFLTKDGSRAKSDSIYLWKDGNANFKIGITTSCYGDIRIRSCARHRNTSYKILRLNKVKNAALLESDLLKEFGVACYNDGLDGYTEFRTLTNTEVEEICSRIDSA